MQDGRYEISLPWNEVHSYLPDYYDLSLNRLRHLQQRLVKQPELLMEYNHIISDQLQKGIIEQVDAESALNLSSISTESKLVHYMPHHAVVRTERATTKLCMVYDGSAKLNNHEPSLNECLQVGFNLIPKLFDILVQFRSHPIALTADIEKAFLMIEIVPADRDVLRFLWFQDPTKIDSPILHFRFNCLVFGLRPSPAILGAVIQHHLSKYSREHPELIAQIRNGLYVDDLVTGNDSVEAAFQVYLNSKKILNDGSLNVWKWNTNSPELLSMISQLELSLEQPAASNVPSISEEEQTYAQSYTSCFNPQVSAECQKLLGTMNLMIF